MNHQDTEAPRRPVWHKVLIYLRPIWPRLDVPILLSFSLIENGVNGIVF